MFDRHFGFIVLFGMLCFLPGIESKKRFVFVIAPRYIIPGSDYVATVDMFNVVQRTPGTYHVTVSLRSSYFSTRDIVSETKALSNGTSRGIFILKVPVGATSRFIHVEVSSGVFYGKAIFYNSFWTPPGDVILVQTDKGVYMAGQTVQFRVMSVNRNREVEVRPVTIDIFDGDKNRIRRWDNVTDSSGVFIGKMEMSQYPVLGIWTIKVQREGLTKTQAFEVHEYELPKFDVTINMPEVVTILDKTLTGTVSSLYTFGKGVTGSLEFILSYFSKKISKIYQMTDGQVNIEIPTSDIYEAIGVKPNSFYSFYRVKATAIVTEDITGNTREDSVDIKFIKFDASIKIESSTTFYAGQSLSIKGRVTSRFGSSFKGQAADMFGVKLIVLYQIRGIDSYKTWVDNKVLPINDNNQFSFTLDGNLITEEVVRITSQAQLFWKTNQEIVKNTTSSALTFRTVNGSLLKVKQVGGSNPMNVGDTARYRISMTGPGALTVTYKKTSISFQTKTQKPRENARLYLKSSPRSSFYVLAVDKSVLLLDEGNDITEAMLQDLYDDELTDINFIDSKDAVDVLDRAKLQLQTFRVKRQQLSSSTASVLTTTSFSDDVITATTSAITVPTRPPIFEPKRTKFPETWLFLNVSADSKGEATILKKVPDTITTWVASCFAVNTESKISIAGKTAELEVFLPFFIGLQLPNSVIRNEQVVLQTIIFNYNTEDLYVLVTLKKSSQFRGLAVVKRRKRRILEEKCGNVVLCIFAKAGRGTAAFFPVIPTSTGNIKITITATSSRFNDTVVKTLKVESEGAPRSVAYPIFIDLSEKTTFDTRLDINYPPNTVEGSKRMRVSIIGDIMGPTLDGLERLVKMPYGCGEQNMVSTAPSVFVYRYFSSVGRLTNEIRQKAENFMRIGMQRQLTYRHPDWSFSAWGGKSNFGSTWLTAFVLKVFSIASNYVEIDSALITKSASYLINIQNPDGSFPEKGRVNNRWLQGGASGTTERMTAFVLIALLEARKASSNLEFCDSCMQNLNKSIERASNFVANNLDNQTSVYTVAISAYALTLADHNGAWRARNKLDDLSKGGPGEKYWEMSNQAQPSKYHFGSSTKSVSIEMTAYGLLAFVDSESLTKYLPILKWISRQRNSNGGFISTQDTVIAIEAMSKMAAKIYSKDLNMNLVLSYIDTQQRKKKFKINSKNTNVMQLTDVIVKFKMLEIIKFITDQISTDTKSISVRAWGTKGSTAIFTVSLFYNIFMDLEDRSLRLEVTVIKETINGFTLKSCVSWLENETSGMVVVEIGIPSGFEANRWGISEHKLLKRTEIEDRKVILYYDEVPFKIEMCTDIRFVRDKMVAKTKPVPCKAYEYYEPSNQVTVFYAPLSAKKANICDICGIECGCLTTKQKIWFPQSWCKKRV